MIYIKKNKKGVSPVIATVLLIVLVVVISAVIFLWFNNLNEEAVTKFGDKNIKIVCDDVQFQLDYNDNSLSIFNSGNVPIYNFKIKVEIPGSYITQSLAEISSWQDTGLDQGKSFFEENILGDVESPGSLTFIPELAGSSNSGEKIHTCEERHGYKITI